jgi:hypothetical protein
MARRLKTRQGAWVPLRDPCLDLSPPLIANPIPCRPMPSHAVQCRPMPPAVFTPATTIDGFLFGLLNSELIRAKAKLGLHYRNSCTLLHRVVNFYDLGAFMGASETRVRWSQLTGPGSALVPMKRGQSTDSRDLNWTRARPLFAYPLIQ